MLGDLIRFKVDKAADTLHVELKEGTVAETLPVAGKAEITLDAEGYVLGIRFNGVNELIQALIEA